MVGLKVYKVKDKENYENLRIGLSGWCFFRHENENYYLKAPLNKTIKNLINVGVIQKQDQTTTEQ
jgi:hypothetical protein